MAFTVNSHLRTLRGSAILQLIQLLWTS